MEEPHDKSEEKDELTGMMGYDVEDLEGNEYRVRMGIRF